jgi:hypothetical protein
MSPGSPARGFARQRGALETLAEAGYERLKQADRPTYESRSGGHSISIRSGFLERRSGAAAPPLRGRAGPAVEISSQASPLSPSPRVPSLGFDPNSLGSEVLQGRGETPPAMRAGQQGCLRAFAGMTPVAMATATACVKFMQLNLWRAVSRYPFTLANDRFRSPAMS